MDEQVVEAIDQVKELRLEVTLVRADLRRCLQQLKLLATAFGVAVALSIGAIVTRAHK